MAKLPIPPASAKRWGAKERIVSVIVGPDIDAVRRALVEARHCPECDEPVTGPPQKRYCTDACRVKAHRARRAGKSVSADTLAERKRCAAVAWEVVAVAEEGDDFVKRIARDIAEEIEHG